MENKNYLNSFIILIKLIGIIILTCLTLFLELPTRKIPTVWRPGIQNVTTHHLLKIYIWMDSNKQHWKAENLGDLKPHHRSRCDCSTSPAPEAPVCRWGWGWAWFGSSPPTSCHPETWSIPVQPGGKAAALQAGETDSLQGQRSSPLIDHPVEQKMFIYAYNMFIILKKVQYLFSF